MLCFQRVCRNFLAVTCQNRIQGRICLCVSGIHSVKNTKFFLAFVVSKWIYRQRQLPEQTCLYVGLGLAAVVLVQMFVHYLSDSLQSAAGYLMFADKRIRLSGHLRGNPWDISLPAILARLVQSSVPTWCSLKKFL